MTYHILHVSMFGVLKQTLNMFANNRNEIQKMKFVFRARVNDMMCVLKKHRLREDGVSRDTRPLKVVLVA